MKKYVQFYAERNGVLVEPCGDRSVIIVDARLSNPNIGAIAAEECRRRGYDAWRVFAGTFTNSRPISTMHRRIDITPVQNPAWLSAHAM